MTTSTIPKLMTLYAERLENAWIQVLTAILKDIAIKNPHSPEAATILSIYTKRAGKFIRPTLFLIGYQLYSATEPSDEVIDLALSFELLHLYLLIHDDIMDQSDIRRGGKSLHVLFEEFHKEQKRKGDTTLYGRNMAILMGDILANEAEKAWTRALSHKIVSPEIKEQFDIMKDEVYWGQYLDLIVPSLSKLPTKSDILSIMKQKTGTYTIVRPLQIGAKITKVNIDRIDWIPLYGEALGIAFQAVDDVLGTFGDPNITGKSAISDIKERKLTILVHYAFETAQPADKKLLTDYYLEDSSEVTPEEVKEVIARTQALDKTEALIKDHYDKSTTALRNSHLKQNQQAMLEEFAHFIIERVK